MNAFLRWWGGTPSPEVVALLEAIRAYTRPPEQEEPIEYVVRRAVSDAMMDRTAVEVAAVRQAAEEAAKALADAPWHQCPECGSRDYMRIGTVIGYKDVAGVATAVERGARVACQRCPHVFTIGPAGVYNQHPLSHPLTPRLPDDYVPPSGKASAVQRANKTEDEVRSRPIRNPGPIPRERPAP